MAGKQLIKANRGVAPRSRRKRDKEPSFALAVELSLSTRRLHHTRALVMTVASALRHQNAEADSEMANVLQISVADALFSEIARLEALASSSASEEVVCSS